MNPCRIPSMMLSGLALLFSPGAHAASACVAQSGTQRAVLLELYTSEGCSSCPPADRRMSQFNSLPELAGRVVPLAFHVDYWDSLGWVDRFASPRHTRRQYAMASRANSPLVYTPQFLKNGRDWRNGGNLLDGPADTGVRITLALGKQTATSLAVDGRVDAGSVGTGAEVYLALYENNLESQVRAGENAGKSLHHDYVVRRLIGPLAPDPGGSLTLHQEIALNPDWKPADLGVAAFVQNKTSGEILQALQRPACPS